MRYFNINGRLMNRAKIRIVVLFVFLWFYKLADAQIVNQNEFLVYCSNNDSIITLNYQATGVVYNLLVQISDSGGRTVFLENKYKFSGNYQCAFYGSLWKEDFLYVQLIADDKRFNKKVKLK